MSFAGKLARGLLQGASRYFSEVAEREEYDRRAFILRQREDALAVLRQNARQAGPESRADEKGGQRDLGAIGGPGLDSGGATSRALDPEPLGPIAEDNYGNRVAWNGRAWLRVR